MKTRLAFVALLWLSAVPSLMAQAIAVNVPFEFVVSDRTLPAGHYFLSSSRDILTLRDSTGKPLLNAMSQGVSGRHVGATGEVVFHCYGTRCFLSELWIPTSDTGHKMMRSHYEMESARNAAQTYFALVGDGSEKGSR